MAGSGSRCLFVVVVLVVFLAQCLGVRPLEFSIVKMAEHNLPGAQVYSQQTGVHEVKKTTPSVDERYVQECEKQYAHDKLSSPPPSETLKEIHLRENFYKGLVSLRTIPSHKYSITTSAQFLGPFSDGNQHMLWYTSRSTKFIVLTFVEYISNNYTRRVLAGCGTGNPIDDCWRCNSNWNTHRQSLAECSIGFGKNAGGGQNGNIYVVTDDSDNDAVNPAPGTLRYGVIQNEPLWIIFSRNMIIQLKEELIMNSYKTLDGRGANVHIAGGACLVIQFVSNVIVHGLHIHDCKSTGPAMVRSTPEHFGYRGVTDGDAITIYGSHDIWVDHNYLSNANDGLVDVTEASTGVTISNNYFTNHDKVMLLGAHPTDTFDTVMQVTIAFNHFGKGLVQRMPRCRFGYFHVVNNYYASWQMYAVGGSENPTINSESNHYLAPNNGYAKEVTKRIPDDGSLNVDGWQNWNWRSAGDILDNGAFFVDSGAAATNANFYAKATSFSARPAAMVAVMTNDAGPLML